MNSPLYPTLLAGIALIGSATAATISVNFAQAAGNTNELILSSTPAGLDNALNWNNVAGANSAAPATLVDNSGAASGASVTWSSKNVWRDGTATTDANAGVGNAMLTLGYLDDGDSGAAVQITGIPYLEFDVTLYFSTDTGGGTYREATFTGSTSGVQTASTTGGKLRWDANPKLDATNTVTVSGLSGSTLDITVLPRDGTSRGSISGFQITEVPEPSMTLLGGLAGLSLLIRRRR